MLNPLLSNSIAYVGPAAICPHTTTPSTKTVTRTLVATATVSAAPDPTAPIVPPTQGRLAFDCHNETVESVAISPRTWSFRTRCGADWAGPDIAALTVYTFRDCLKACASYNRNSGVEKCVAVVFNPDLTWSIRENFGTCLLKNATGTGFYYREAQWTGAMLVVNGTKAAQNATLPIRRIR
jgi:hypothetical protein